MERLKITGVLKDTILQIKNKLKSIHPLPWTASGNYPFDVQLQKPRHSLSKHTEKNPCSWHYDDAEYLLMCVNKMPEILEHIEKIEKETLQCLDKIDKEQRPFVGIPEKDYYRGQHDALTYMLELLNEGKKNEK